MNGDHAHKLLERMRGTQSGWGQGDFERLLVGFGFEWREGKKHRIYYHPRFPELSISVPRHNALKEWVARDAIKLIDDLKEREERESGRDQKDA